MGHPTMRPQHSPCQLTSLCPYAYTVDLPQEVDSRHTSWGLATCKSVRRKLT